MSNCFRAVINNNGKNVEIQELVDFSLSWNDQTKSFRNIQKKVNEALTEMIKQQKDNNIEIKDSENSEEESENEEEEPPEKNQPVNKPTNKRPQISIMYTNKKQKR